MPYASKKDGVITGLFSRPQFEGDEYIKDDDADVLAFRNSPPTKQERIAKAERNQTMRYLRGAILGDAYSITKLQEIEDEIKSIR